MKIQVSLNKDDLKQLVVEKKKKTGHLVKDFVVFTSEGEISVSYERVLDKTPKYVDER